MIYRYFLLLIFSFFTPLQSYYTDWKDDNSSTGSCSDTSEWDNHYYSFDVSYGGISFNCDYGCGHPSTDPLARSIQHLCYCWVNLPLFPCESLKMNSLLTKNQGLTKFKGEFFYRYELRPYEWDEDFGQPYDQFLWASNTFLQDLLTIKEERKAACTEHIKNKNIIRELESKGARFIKIDEVGEVEGFERSSFGNFQYHTVKEALENEDKEIEFEKACI